MIENYSKPIKNAIRLRLNITFDLLVIAIFCRKMGVAKLQL